MRPSPLETKRGRRIENARPGGGGVTLSILD